MPNDLTDDEKPDSEFVEFIRIQERSRKIKRYAIIGSVVVGTAIAWYSLYTINQVLMADSDTNVKVKGKTVSSLMDGDITESLIHYKVGNSTTGQDREVLCYVESTPGNPDKLKLVCGNEFARVPVQPDRYANIPMIEATPDPLGGADASTERQEFRAPTGEAHGASPMELPERNTWLKDGISTRNKDVSPSNTVVKSRPVLSKYCSRFLERKGVCRIPRGDYQPTAD
jgi:hypothetical protein